ncbi:MAG: imidazole glycerol phosphate synthase subunit HisH, partial [Halothiobacillaceae bacterium]
GMQVLFEEGEELGHHIGLGLLPGRVIRLPADLTVRGFKIPHTGWNQIAPTRPHLLLTNLPPGAWVYFNHSYICQSRPEHTLAITEYGCSFPAVVGHGNLLGVQFHPEKSQRVGLQILRNFVEGRI